MPSGRRRLPESSAARGRSCIVSHPVATEGRRQRPVPPRRLASSADERLRRRLARHHRLVQDRESVRHDYQRRSSCRQNGRRRSLQSISGCLHRAGKRPESGPFEPWCGFLAADPPGTERDDRAIFQIRRKSGDHFRKLLEVDQGGSDRIFEGAHFDFVGIAGIQQDDIASGIQPGFQFRGVTRREVAWAGSISGRPNVMISRLIFTSSLRNGCRRLKLSLTVNRSSPGTARTRCSSSSIPGRLPARNRLIPSEPAESFRGAPAPALQPAGSSADPEVP